MRSGILEEELDDAAYFGRRLAARSVTFFWMGVVRGVGVSGFVAGGRLLPTPTELLQG